ncbi:MAG: hypothetical protein ACK559_29585, partial [bacterium]
IFIKSTFISCSIEQSTRRVAVQGHICQSSVALPAVPGVKDDTTRPPVVQEAVAGLSMEDARAEGMTASASRRLLTFGPRTKFKT